MAISGNLPQLCVGDRGIGRLNKSRHREKLSRLHQIDQMMPNLGLLSGAWLGGADVHPR